ncbi:helix-turn-helix domain-containing protein [Streptomyces sp. NPDC057363]|uniref:helix-turn-helix domain-containing protein n=1 Tax=Streptomyces sp. NPDC057363 TaxID=3346107 RepID=UPI00363CC5EE
MQVQRTRHTRAYVQIPNEIARHQTLSLEARGLLTYLLSLPDANGATVERITERTPNGRRSVSSAMNELVAAGYVTRARMQDPETGRWVTLTSVTDTPTNHMPTVGLPTRQAVGGSPQGEEKTESKKDTTPPPAQPEEKPQEPSQGTNKGGEGKSPLLAKIDREMSRQARLTLERLSLHKSLPLTDQDIARLAPKVVPWLREDYRSDEILRCLTQALPEQISSVPGLISHRLKTFTPERSAPRQVAPQLVKRTACEVCEALFPLGHQGGICRDCQAEMNRANARFAA